MPRLAGQEADAFEVWIWQELRLRAAEAGVGAGVFDAFAKHAAFLPEVLERQAGQKEFLLPIREYLEIVVSRERIAKGRRMLRRYRALFNKIEADFGVEPPVAASIWGVETGYGVIRGEFPTLSALATLAFRGRRANYFSSECIAALRLVEADFCTVQNMRGSWAGALGHGQFMPSSVIEYGIDFDGDGKADLCHDDPADALASIAHYLAEHGWRRGQPWGFEVVLPDGFDFAQAGLDQSRPSKEWARLGVRSAAGGGLPEYGTGSILLPAGALGPALLVLRNFHAILRYNSSEAYALAVGQLSDRLLGAADFRAKWPADERALTRDEIAEVQLRLTQAGFSTEGIDGLSGPDTRKAVRAWQMARGLVPDGYIGEAVLMGLRRAETR